jgi:hypothetical protein
MLSRKTVVVTAAAALVAVPVAPSLAAPHGLKAAGLAARTHANVLHEGALAARAARAHERLVRKNDRLAHKVARARKHKLPPNRVERVRTFGLPRLLAENRELAHKLRKYGAGASTASPQLQAIAACESGGDPRSIGGGGAFRGKYQFTYGTWASVGGKGDPAAAPEAEQDKRAQMLLDRSGSSPWPVCGR